MKNKLLIRTFSNFNWNPLRSKQFVEFLSLYNEITNSQHNSRPNIPVNLESDQIDILSVTNIINGNLTNSNNNNSIDLLGESFTDTSLMEKYLYYQSLINSRICEDVISLHESGVYDTLPNYFSTYNFNECLSYLYLAHECRKSKFVKTRHLQEINLVLVVEFLYQIICSHHSVTVKLLKNFTFTHVYTRFLKISLLNSNDIILYSMKEDNVVGHNKPLYVAVASSLVYQPNSIPVYKLNKFSNCKNMKRMSQSIKQRVKNITIEYLNTQIEWSSVVNDNVYSPKFQFTDSFSVQQCHEPMTNEYISRMLGIDPSPFDMYSAYTSFSSLGGCGIICEEFMDRYDNCSIFSKLLIYSMLTVGTSPSSLPDTSYQTQSRVINVLSKLLFHFRYPLNIICYLNGFPFLLNSNFFSKKYSNPRFDHILSDMTYIYEKNVNTNGELFNYYIKQYSITPECKYSEGKPLKSNTLLSEAYLQDLGIPLHINLDTNISSKNTYQQNDGSLDNSYAFADCTRYNNIVVNSLTSFHFLSFNVNLVSLKSQSFDDELRLNLENQIKSKEKERKVKINPTISQSLNELLLENRGKRIYFYDDESKDQNESNSEIRTISFTYDIENRLTECEAVNSTLLNSSVGYEIISSFIIKNAQQMAIQPWDEVEIGINRETFECEWKMTNEILESIKSSNITKLITQIINEFEKDQCNRNQVGNLKMRFNSGYKLVDLNQNDLYRNKEEVNELKITILNSNETSLEYITRIIKYSENCEKMTFNDIKSNEFKKFINSQDYNIISKERSNESTTNVNSEITFNRNNEELAMASLETKVNDGMKKTFNDIAELVISNSLYNYEQHPNQEEIECEQKKRKNEMIIINLSNESIMNILLNFDTSEFQVCDLLISYIALGRRALNEAKISNQLEVYCKADFNATLTNEEWEIEDALVNRTMSKCMKFAKFIRILTQN